MTADQLVSMVRSAMAEGNNVEISVPFYKGFQPISAIEVLYEDWIEFEHSDLDVTVCVPLNKIDGVRVGNNP